MNQGKLEVVKQEMARVNVDILGISELRWTGMGEFIRLPLVFALGSPNFPSSCEGKLGVVLESLQGQRDLI